MGDPGDRSRRTWCVRIPGGDACVPSLGLAALDNRAEPSYGHEIVGHLVQTGWHVAVMTPGGLAECVVEKVRGGRLVLARSAIGHSVNAQAYQCEEQLNPHSW